MDHGWCGKFIDNDYHRSGLLFYMSLPSTILMGNLDQRISHQVMPEGGWKFQQGSITIRGLDWIDLVKSFKDHRRNNKMPEGNPEKEIEEQILITHPHLRRK